MTPEEIEIKIQEVQQLIELVRAETQKGGNTKERVANLLTQINEIIAELNERPSGGDVVTDSTLKGTGITGNALGLSDAKNNEIAGKLDKIASPNNTSERIINADGSTTSKSEFERTNYVAATLPATALESWKGLIIYFSGSGALTIPNTLSDGWTINGITELSASLSLSLASGKSWRFGTPESIPEKQIFTITQRVNNIYLLGV